MKSKPFINAVEVSNSLLNLTKSATENMSVGKKEMTYINDFLSEQEINAWVDFIQSQNRIPVGLDGIKDNYNPGDVIGNYRLSIFNEDLVALWWQRIAHMFDVIWVAKNQIDETSTDNTKSLYKPVGINPLLRIIEYKQNGQLISHYDAPYIYNNRKQTLKSFIIYLTSNNSGSTQFIWDDQQHLPNHLKDFSDRKSFDSHKEMEFFPVAGNALVFDHRIFHRVLPTKELKIIIRTDIIYEKVE
jgi:hypothetical protein